MDTEILNTILKPLKAFGLLGKISVNSALNPLLWAMGIFLFFMAAILISGQVDFLIIIIFVILLFLIVLCLLGGFLYFMFKKPDYLRSETYQLQRYSMEMMGEKNKELVSQVIEAESDTKSIAQLPGRINKIK